MFEELLTITLFQFYRHMGGISYQLWSRRLCHRTSHCLTWNLFDTNSLAAEDFSHFFVLSKGSSALYIYIHVLMAGTLRGDSECFFSVQRKSGFG